MNALPLSHTFEYGGNGAGELTKVIFPYKGELRWAHGDSITYSNQQKLREVKYRYLVKQLGAPATGYTLEYDADTTVPMHRYGLVKDPNGISQKLWYFYLNDSASPYYGLLQVLQEWVQGTGAIPRHTWPGYARDAAPHFNRYISSMAVQLDPQAAYTKTMRTEQTLDIYGNVTLSKVFDFGNTTTPLTNMEVITSISELKPGDFLELHIHHGIEAGTVLQGGMVQAPGKDPFMLPTGAPIMNLRDVPHAGWKVVGDSAIRIFTVHIVDKGRQ